MQVGQHLALAAGQRKLLDSRVLVLGAGGLGSPAAMYLAAAGVGTLGLVDDDVVDASNLQRQILHGTSRLGSPKVDSGAQTLRELNPDVEVVTFRERLDRSNVERIFDGFDLVLDGCDNFATRQEMNDWFDEGHFAKNVYGYDFDPEDVYKWHAAGVPDAEIFERTYGGEAPDLSKAFEPKA